MSRPAWQRLSPLDHAFLLYESDTAPMHVAATLLFDAAPLRRSDGRLDIERIRAYVGSRLHRIPRYRQRLASPPLGGRPIWIDDPSFDIRYHVRHAALPRPGDERQLKRAAGRIFSQRLDREKPLWELWVMEGVAEGRVALLSKVHHCMVDGISGAEILAELLAPRPRRRIETAPPFVPRPAPGAVRLGADSLARALRAPLALAGAGCRALRSADPARHEVTERARALGSVLGEVLRGASPAPFNQPIGPHRRVDWLPIPLERVRAVRRGLGGTVNDIVLATAAGGLARFLERFRGVDLAALDFRVMEPVSVRPPEEQRTLGNRVSAWVLPLPLAERDPVARLDRIRARTAALKESRQALGAETLTATAEWTGSGLLSLGARLVRFGTPFNMVITNVPGPQVPLYLLAARMRAAHAFVPLLGQLGLGIALFSYDGTISFGFDADWDLVPDLHALVRTTRRAFEELEQAAGVRAA